MSNDLKPLCTEQTLRLLRFFFLLKRIIIHVVLLREQLFPSFRRLAGNVLNGNTLADVGGVVRMALLAMAELNPKHAEEYAIKFWNRGKYSEGSSDDEYQKIMALWVLKKIKSPKLEEYLDKALKSNYKMLIVNAEKIVQSLNQA